MMPNYHYLPLQFSLASDIISLLKRPKTYGTQYKNSPLVRPIYVTICICLVLYFPSCTINQILYLCPQTDGPK